MSFLMYQRSDPRSKDWPPFVTQQIRLRNIIQIIGINIETNSPRSSHSSSPKPKSPGRKNSKSSNPPADIEIDDEEIYFTLHSRPMSVPFYTSDKVKIETLVNKTKSKVIIWKEIEPRDISESVRLSTTGCIICIWSSLAGQQKTIVSWGVFFQGLHYLGSKPEWNSHDFKRNTLIFHAPFGYFTSLESFIKRPTNTQRYVSLVVPRSYIRPSYNVKSLATLHGVQRSILEEVAAARQLKASITLYGYSPEICRGTSGVNLTSMSPSSTSSFHSSLLINEKILVRVQQGRSKLQLKEEIQNLKLRINVLHDEKEKAVKRVAKLRADKLSQEVNKSSLDLLNRMHSLGREKSRLLQLKVLVQEKKRVLSDLSSKLFTRRKQLISELLLIYPVSLIEGSKRYSINEVQLPNAEDYGSEGGGQISVALGYTAHMVAMLSFFLGVPLRYPISHFGSRSRISDHITVQIPDKEREFPLYFRSKEDVYSKYGVYLLNKNVAQLRWYCGLSTSDLRATLPNLLNLLVARLTIPGWPPSPGESLEIAQELTGNEEVDQQLFRSEISKSLDKGLDQLDHEKDIENAWLRSSFSDLECAIGNVVPSGEVRHSRAQDRFLSGWRKKTYESEDIDSNWLINSLNLDFDAGRRLSSSSTSSLTTFNRLGQPMIFLNDDGLGLHSSQSRRYGRIEKFGNNTLTIPSDSVKFTVATNSTPNENMSHVEKHIKQLERKRSFCTDRHYDNRGRRHSSSTESPSTSIRQGVETDKDRLEDGVADFVRRMSLVEMQLNRGKTPDIEEHCDEGTEDNLVEEEEVDIEDPPVVKEDDSKATPVELSERDLLYSKPLSPVHLSTKYEHYSSGDERGDTPSPSFLRKPSQQQDIHPDPNNPLEKLAENVLNLQANTENKPDQAVVSNGQICHQLYENISSTDAASPILNEAISIEKDVPLILEDSLIPSPCSTVDNHNLSQSSFCDKNINDSESTTANESDLDDASLWFRTEALVTNSKSFNMVKRRISESN